MMRSLQRHATLTWTEKSSYWVSTHRRRRRGVEPRWIVGFARTQQMIDDAQERTSEDREGLFLGAAVVEESRVADAPFRSAAGRHEGGERECVAQGPRTA